MAAVDFDPDRSPAGGWDRGEVESVLRAGMLATFGEQAEIVRLQVMAGQPAAPPADPDDDGLREILEAE